MSRTLPIVIKDLSKLASAINVSNELNDRKHPALATPPPTSAKLAGTLKPTNKVRASKSDASTSRNNVPRQDWKQSLAASQLPRLNGALLGMRRSRSTTRQTVKARITALAQLLDCSPALLVQYLSTLYVRQFTPTTLLHEEELAAVLSRHGRPDRLQNVEIVDAINTPSAKRTDENNVVLLFENNLFEHVQQTVFYDRLRVKSHFSDEQAVVICSKIADSYARTLAANYQRLDTTSVQASIYRYQLHFLAEKARHRYGGPS